MTSKVMKQQAKLHKFWAAIRRCLTNRQRRLKAAKKAVDKCC